MRVLERAHRVVQGVGDILDRRFPAERFAEGRRRSDRWLSADRELREALLALIPPAWLPPATVKRARQLIAHIGITADLVEFADEHTLERQFTKLDPDVLAWGPPSAAGLVVTHRMWPAMEGYLERDATRAAMWQALRSHLADVPHDLLADILDATAALCDDAAGVEAAFAPHLRDIPRHRLDHAVARIRRCTALRARTGNLPL